ncbi:MAG: hypothetical protein ALECFALPRED_002404 [Alectoria fallacina]|uniref:BTB domain-containing protein n=1 Tax=Alectoria fallacina TaxID=1903189 RepID=A0A8H3FFH1_9LECA|nr:MAG: hypothetical protein ALECFALPRED_002404 [Alectoria fallacina]
MFSSFRSRNRVSKTVKPIKRSVGERSKLKMQQKLDSPMAGSTMVSSIWSIVVGPDLRLFAAYEHALLKSPYFAKRLRDQFYETSSKRLKLPDMLPEVFACVLEYLYTDDYYPRLCKSKRHHSWELEDAQDTRNSGGRGRVPSTIYHPEVDGNYLLTDTAVYCAAEKLGLEELKRLALLKQGLRFCALDDILIRSARYAYANTLDTDRRLRPFFIQMIIQDRTRFIRSPTMQMEMGLGGSKFFFDLFVALCLHTDEFVERTNKSSPRTI